MTNKYQKGFIQIPILIALIAGLLVVGGAGYFGIKQYQNHQIEKEGKPQEAQNGITEPEGPTEVSGNGFYGITLESTPVISAGEVNLKIKLKNLNVTPFITNLGSDSCNVTDSKGIEHLAEFTSEIKLKKAILPGEEILIDIVRQRLRTSYLRDGEVACSKEGIDPALLMNNEIKCVYSGSGECLCENVKITKINDCIFRITTDGKIASNNWGKYPLTVTIEK